MKWILSFALAFLPLFLNASDDGFLEPNKAFVINIVEKQDSINVDIKLDKTIYIYHDKTTVLINGTDVTKKVFTRKPVDHDGFIVHMGDFNLNVPKTLIKEIVKNGSYNVIFKYQGCSMEGLCYAPMEKSFKGVISDTISQAEAPQTVVNPLVADANETNTTTEMPIGAETNLSVSENQTIEANSTLQETQKDETSSIADILSGGNIFLILATFFGFGLLLSLTPCIFPMIPILSSIIVKHSSEDGSMSASKGFMLSLVYVLSMSAAYTIAGVLAGLFGANIQAMLQNPIVLVVFAGVFVALAFSLFGYFSLELPQSLQNKINNITGNSQKQGVAGVAIMGFLSALIVGPCVAPPLAGALVYIGQTGDAVLGGLALFVMSLGLGMPLLAVGAGAGKYMPKPGGWMETVSKTFGIVMLGLAIYMLERVLDDVVIIYMWAILLIGAALYLQEFKHIIAKVITTIIFIYGVVVFVGAVSGGTNPLNPLENFTAPKGATEQSGELQFQNVKTIAELDNILATTNKPVMVDFWATWCVSCKELDNLTLTDAGVKKALDGYTLLRVDVSNNTNDDKELMKKFNVFGPPALMFFDQNGTLIPSKRIVGYKNPQEFLEILAK